LISLALEVFYVMNLQAEAQLLCLEIGDGSRRLNKFGNKTRANMKSHICPVHICPLAYNYRNMDCSARLVLSLLAGPNNGQSCDKKRLMHDCFHIGFHIPPDISYWPSFGQILDVWRHMQADMETAMH
jgi:hypothetical protein